MRAALDLAAKQKEELTIENDSVKHCPFLCEFDRHLARCCCQLALLCTLWFK